MIDALSWMLIIAGCFVVLTGSIGINRFPEFFTRVHAASLTDTLGIALLVFGLMLQAGFTQVALKLALLLFCILWTGPVAGHALTKAALHGKLRPWIHDNNRDSHDNYDSRRNQSNPGGNSR
ncbi:MAG: monovalent cation/H(+) antiporter subunit G [Gammaproteobacteria bacterium]|nr:monovalent cation/H(+) antiporter subunit G [Gammaproteobacteria bacterium]